MTVTVRWVGKSGQTYECETFQVGMQFNHVSGVYILCRQLVGQSLEALYVGEAESLHNRLNSGTANHDGFKCASNKGLSCQCLSS